MVNASAQCKRSGAYGFHFELDSVGITLPLRLPSDRGQAYELLSACVQEFIATYRRDR